MKPILCSCTFVTACFAGAGHFNDPDMLEIGILDVVSQFSLWCVAKAPLMISTDPSKLNESILEILGNTDAIAVNQDILGVQGRRAHRSGQGHWRQPAPPPSLG